MKSLNELQMRSDWCCRSARPRATARLQGRHGPTQKPEGCEPRADFMHRKGDVVLDTFSHRPRRGRQANRKEINRPGTRRSYADAAPRASPRAAAAGDAAATSPKREKQKHPWNPGRARRGPARSVLVTARAGARRGRRRLRPLRPSARLNTASARGAGRASCNGWTFGCGTRDGRLRVWTVPSGDRGGRRGLGAGAAAATRRGRPLPRGAASRFTRVSRSRRSPADGASGGLGRFC